MEAVCGVNAAGERGGEISVQHPSSDRELGMKERGHEPSVVIAVEGLDGGGAIAGGQLFGLGGHVFAMFDPHTASCSSVLYLSSTTTAVDQV